MKRMRVALLLTTAVFGCAKADPDAIVPYGRENNSGTYMYFKEHVLEDADFAANVQTLPGTAAVINAVSKDKRAIGYGGIGYVKGVRTLRVKKDAAAPALEPSLENVVNGTYPISRYLYFYTVGLPEGAVKHFVNWARGEEGQKICEQVGYYPLPKEKRSTVLAAGAGRQTVTVKGSDTMVILGQRWAEHYMKLHPETLVQITGGGSGTGIAALINGSTNICQSSRPIRPKEREQVRRKHGRDAVEFEVAMDGLAVFVHESNALEEIALERLRDIYTGKIRNWRDVAHK